MQLPHLQIETKEAERLADELVALAKKHLPDDIVRHEHFWWRGLLEAFWQWGLAVSGNARPDGTCRGQNADVRVAGALKWPHDVQILVDWLVELELLEVISGGLRVRGVAKRYGGAWDRKTSEAERKRVWRDEMTRKRAEEKEKRESADRTRTSARKTQKQTQTQKKTQKEIQRERDPNGSGSGEAPPPPATNPLPTPPTLVTPPTSPPEAWLGEDFWRWAECERQAAGLPPQKPPHPSKLSGWWSSALSVQPDVEALKEAFLNFGDDKHWQAATPPLPFGAFMSQWADFLPVRRVHAS